MKKNELFEKLYTKEQVKKWRNIALVCILFAVYLGIRILRSDYDTKADYIARVHIDGIIENNNYRDDRLEKIIDDEKIKAVIFLVDSQGGAIVTSEQIYNTMRKIAEKKPIVVVMGNMAASGGYLVSLASDQIFAGNGTITGSIGVILQTFEALDLMKKVGVTPLTYKSSELKATPSLFQKPTKKSEEVLAKSIEDSHKFFMELVAERRKMDMEKVKQIADGRIFTGRQALKEGLIDAIGYEPDAINYLRVKKGIDTEKFETKNYELNESINNFRLKKFLTYFFGDFSSSFNLNKSGGIMAVYEVE